MAVDAAEIVKKHVSTQLVHGPGLAVNAMEVLGGCVDTVPDRCSLIRWEGPESPFQGTAERHSRDAGGSAVRRVGQRL